MEDLTVIAISLSVILLCWAVVRVNQRIDQALRNSPSSKELDRAHETSE